jgi:hypothetical protein
VALSILVVRRGMAGARVSEMSGTVPGRLYPGAHMVMPLVKDVVVRYAGSDFYDGNFGRRKQCGYQRFRQDAASGWGY